MSASRTISNGREFLSPRAHRGSGQLHRQPAATAQDWVKRINGVDFVGAMGPVIRLYSTHKLIHEKRIFPCWLTGSQLGLRLF